MSSPCHRGNLTETLDQMGDRESAHPFVDNALPLQSTTTTNFVYHRGNLTETLDQMGDRESARKLLQDTVAELKQVGDLRSQLFVR